jgi:RNA polymerase sigma-70 factor (ECF subfamily)
VGNASTDRTSATLLGRLRQSPDDSEAWQEFVARYRPRILAWCAARGLQTADVEDVAQTVLLRLVSNLRDFRYDRSRSFRAWLKTVTQNVLSDYLTQKKGEAGSGDSQVVRLLENVEAREELSRHLESEFDQELLEEALRRVRQVVPAERCEAFRLTALEGLSGAAAAVKEFSAAQTKSRKNANPAIFGQGNSGDPERTFGACLLAVQTKNFKRLEELGSHFIEWEQPEKKTEMSTQTGVHGGFAVPTEHYNRLMELVVEKSLVRKRPTTQIVTGHSPSRVASAFARAISA